VAAEAAVVVLAASAAAILAAAERAETGRNSEQAVANRE
jgi:hypothetical protein